MFDISEPIVQLLGVGLTESGSASLAADSTVSASVTVVTVASVSLSAGSVLSADAGAVLVASADLSAESDLIAGLFQEWDASASLSADVSLVVSANRVQSSAALVVGSSNLTAIMVRVRDTDARIMDLEVVGTFTAQVGHPARGRDFKASSSLTATIYTNPRLLVLPTVEYAYTDHVLLERYPIDNGQALLITNGVGELLDFPAQQLIADAEYYFGGGRRNELTPEEEAAVVAAGYGEYIETEFLS